MAKEVAKSNDKIYFITSNQTKLNKYITYSLSKNKAYTNLVSLLQKQEKYKREDFMIHAYSFEIVSKELKDKDKDPKTKEYKANITLKYNKNSFEATITFKERKKSFNTFFYDLQFKESGGWLGTVFPPPSIKFAKIEQLKIFNEVLRLLKVKQGEPLSINLITDSLTYLRGQKYRLDYYLEIFRSCFSKKEVMMTLMMFNLEKVLLPEKLEKKDYLKILEMIEKNPNIIIKHCSEKDDKNKYYRYFYSLLLFFRLNYEKEKVQALIDNKDLWKHFVVILPKNYKYLSNLNISDDLIDEMLKQKEVSFEIIKGTLMYGGTIERILSIINNNCDLISKCCLNEKQKINMSEIANPKQTDDLNKIINEIEKILNYQLKTKKIFILFEEAFWHNYIHYNDNNNLKNLVLIKKAILLCKKVDTEKKLNLEKLKLNSIIHNTGLKAIEEGKLINEELLNYIENDDDYFKDEKKKSNNYRPLTILKGIDLEKVDDKFFEKWNKSSIFKIFSFCDYDFKKELINKINDMKDFGKLLKLFNYNDNKIFDIYSANLLREKFKNLIKTYKIETCPNFIKDVSSFIYIIDQKFNNNIINFMENTIEKYIQSNQTITDIYLYLFSNYKDISKNAINIITNYFTKNKDKLNGESILFLLKKFNSQNFLKSILNKINACVIKEEQLFSQEKEIDSFKLLEGIEKEELLKKFPELYETTYLANTINLSGQILNKIKKGEIKYKSVFSMWLEKEKKEIIKERLNILLFNNIKDVDDCMKEIDTRFKNIIKATTFIKKLKIVFKEFYEIKHQNDIKTVNDLEKQINEKMLNEIEKEETKATIDKLQKIIPDLDRKYKLKSSIFFTYFFKTKKANNVLKKEDDIFSEVEEDFKKLKSFFEENWFSKIDESIVKECYKALKNKTDKIIQSELRFLKDNFGLKELDNLYLEKLQDEIKIFSKKEEIFQTVNSCIHFISEFQVKPTDFNDLLIKLRGDLSKNISVDQIRQYGKSLEKYGINILNPKEEDKDYLNILIALYSKKGSLNFIMRLTDDECHNMHELVSETENTLLTGAEIQDMTKCSNFVHHMNIQKDITTDQELMKIFIEKVQQTKNISAYFIQYTTHSGQIQELFLQKSNKSQASLKQIKNIIKYSSFKLSIINTQELYLEFFGKFSDEEQEKEINFEHLIELRGRAMLTRKLGDENAKEEKETYELNKDFAERVNEIEKINDLLKKIAEKGYCENIEILVEIKEAKPLFYYLNEINFKNYEECSIFLNNILTKTTETQIKYYKNEKTQSIRYIYGRQFILFNNCLKNLKNVSLSAFLKFLTNDGIKSDIDLEKIDYNYDYELNKDKYVCLLENINNFIKSFLLKNNITLETIYKQNIIKEKYKNNFKGLYTYLLKDDKDIQKGVEEHILYWYHALTEHPPMAQTLLLCNEETTSEEIIAFMYRAILCKYHVIFMVGKIELLNPDKRQVLTGLINTLFSGHEEEMESCLAFAYSDKTATIVQYLEKIKGKQILELKDAIKNEEIKYEENVEITYSDKSGVGKSKKIKMKVERSHKKYIHFPFGGEFNRKDVINRLKKIEIENPKNTVIHLDLYDSKQTDLMKDFLYSFLITKLYGQSETLFYLSKDVEIQIEIPNGFIDFFLKFPILSMFKNIDKMSIENLPPLIVPPQINSNIQIVCNYLKLLKSGKLADKDLYIKNVSMEPKDIKALLNPDFIKDDTQFDGVSLSQKECEDLIKEYIDIKLPTYYQINCFINSLSGQLKKFSMNFQLTAGNLIQNGNLLRRQNLKNIRVIMINSFIKNTQHFTQGAFNKLLNSQLESYKVGVEQGKYDEDKQDDVAIKALSNAEDIISFDKIKPSLIFFHEGVGQDFSIISTCAHTEQEYKDLFQLKEIPVIILNELYKMQGINKREKMPKELNNYRQFSHKMFLSEIKKILEITNPVYKSDKNENNKDLLSVEEIVGEYVFTADNFIKMILILLRIRENIPVIMMGETGCGKTSLIRKLSELINNGKSKMKILNIHAGITDQEIVEFLFEGKNEGDRKIPSIVKEAEELEKEEKEKRIDNEKKGFKYFEKKLWIFLDEINTCNSMGLICEMMTKNSCQGRRLPDNIVFIGACNPYRRVQKTQEEPNGLKTEGTKERKVVFTVNPLPHSLLNFVFNFGNLTEEDEKSYIRNMIVSPIESFYWKEIEDKKEKKEKEVKEAKDVEDEIKKSRNIENYLSKEVFEECSKLKEIASSSIIEAQKFVREKNDVSSVSLREIRRFSIFYDFFVKYLRNKKALFIKMDQENENFEIDRFYKNLTDNEIYIFSINLSVYTCYYLRLTKKEFRNEFTTLMNKFFGRDFREIPKKEQEYIANNIEMKEGIAKNTALLENIFSLFVCVNSKVPLFIVGKPGCSKSLSVQLLLTL